MESLSLASLSLASILASASAGTDNEPVSQSVIQTHISPAIAGSWVLQLSKPSSQEVSEQKPATPQVELSRDNPLNLPNIENSLEENIEGIEGVAFESGQTSQSKVTTTSISDKTSDASSRTDCKETYTFAHDNIMWSVSGAEWTYGRYVLSHQNEGLPLIAINTLHDNNEVDCSGNQVDQTGEMMLAYVDYESDVPYMHWCADKEGKDCFMTFKKMLP